MNLSPTFSQLCWQSGFILSNKGLNAIDKQALSDYLAVNIRTLNRWLAGQTPCPRAVKLLKLRLNQFNDGWKDFYYDRNNRLGHITWRLTYPADEVRLFPEILSDRQQYKRQVSQLSRQFDMMYNVRSLQKHRQGILNAVEQLKDIANEPLFQPQCAVHGQSAYDSIKY